MALQRFACTIFLITLLFSLSAQQRTPAEYVDPFIGSEGVGNVFVGPSVPYGMVKPGPDYDNNANSGYHPDLKKPLLSFSQLHVSGTGGGAKYGNIGVMPFGGDFHVIPQESLREKEDAKLGFYGVTLSKWNIQTALTATHKVAFYQFTFNKPGQQAVKLDAGKLLNEGLVYGAYEAQFLVGSEIEILSDREIKGHNRVRGGWNNGTVYTVYFHAVFDRPFADFETWKKDKLFPGKRLQLDEGDKTGALLYFKPSSKVLKLKMGISFISAAKAAQNIIAEAPGWSFDNVWNQCRQKWSGLLEKIEIDPNSPEDKKIMFYTALYHTMLMPVDRSDENPLWKSDLPYYDDFYAIWDTYRSSSPLITLIDPNRQVAIINALLNIYLHEGYMPDARSGNVNGRTQGGSNAEIMIADALVKELKGIDYNLALQAMLKDADIPPGGNEEKEGRGGLYDYNRLGYVSLDYHRAGTRTLEYAYNDFCISSVAKALGKQDIYDRFIRQSGNWKNLWRNYSDHGAKGFIMPKNASGKWVDSIRCYVNDNNWLAFTPLTKSRGQCVCWWCGFLYEATSWEYSLSIPHNVAGLIEYSGGPEAFRTRLDTFFINRYYNVSNEPSFLSPVLYHWIGKPHLSTDRVRMIVNRSFNASRNGLPGNDDSGAMSSWLAFHLLGLYPNAGQSYYLINTPFVKSSTLKLADNKTFKILAPGLDEKNKYIISASLNGQLLEKAWIEHKDIIKGGVLELQMGAEPGNWGSLILPPSNPD